ncbi:MAG TPA: glycosyltransferase [Steroidobacteraceae bacterium]|nr:glycosyltransferase [Steroidobacteraceae bacterium]
MILLALLSLGIWIYLIAAHGAFWLSRPELAPVPRAPGPPVDIVVPARDEEATIGAVVASLLAQDYAGSFTVTVVDDNSTDRTAERAGAAPSLGIVRGAPKPEGWVGKMWALEQGAARGTAPLILFTDADIVHEPRHLSTLVAHLQGSRLDMASEMVRLNCVSLAERALVPAFVYFFQMLYPFRRANDPRSNTAAAAGGTILIRRGALERIGGVHAIREALIDDVSLARAVKRSGGSIFIGHSTLAVSIRPYPAFADIWRMIARTAFTQLRYSAWLLLGTVLGLSLVWLVPPVAALTGSGAVRACGVAACVLAASSYLPTLARYRRSYLWSLALPLIALFYMAATVGSAADHWRGAGARWKSRSYREPV